MKKILISLLAVMISFVAFAQKMATKLPSTRQTENK